MVQLVFENRLYCVNTAKLLISFGAKICLYSSGTGERMAYSTDVAIMRVRNAKSPHAPPP
jgi:hypothetical protein